MSTLTTLATTAMPVQRGLPLWLSMWGSLFGKSAAPLRSDAYASAYFDGQIQYTQIGRLRLCRILATPHRVLRSNTDSLADSRGYKVVIQVRGTSSFEQCGRSTVLVPGDWTLYDAGKPYCVSNPESIEQYNVVLPRDVFASRLFQMDRHTAQRYCGRHGVGRLACEMVRLAFEEFSEQHLQSTEDLAQTVVRLFQQAVLERSGQESPTTRSQLLRDRIKAYIENNIRDPNLSLHRLARELNRTKRNLHRAFEVEGQTIGDFIRTTRLESSRRALLDPLLAGRSVTDIAYGCGFSTSAHFSRQFKAAFGVCPREFRRAPDALAATPDTARSGD